jgi:hypothetical protein
MHADDFDAAEYELESDGGLDQAATFDEDDDQGDESDSGVENDDVDVSNDDEVHEVEEDVWVDPILFDNRVDELGEAGLSEREAQVVAAKEQGHTHEKVADFLSKYLEKPVPKSTVDEYSRRARSKVIQARKLIEEAGDVYE